MFRWERRMCREAAEVIAVSPQDAGLMRDMLEVTRVTAIPTGVDIDFFRRPPEVQPKADLVFLGSMDWLPNIDGIEYFVREILPLIRKRMPECTWRWLVERLQHRFGHWRSATRESRLQARSPM